MFGKSLKPGDGSRKGLRLRIAIANTNAHLSFYPSHSAEDTVQAYKSMGVL